MGKKTKIFDLVIVLSIAFLPSIIQSIFVITNAVTKRSSPAGNLSVTISIVHALLSLLLLYYVLNNRGKNIKSLGVSFNIKDILLGLAVAVGTYLVYWVSSIIIYFAFHLSSFREVGAKNIDVANNKSFFLLIIFALVNPFYEELIVRGFAIKELVSITNKRWIAVIASTLIQASYHLYQGWISTILVAIVFLCFSLFYIKTGKLTPILVAHLIFDVFMMLRLTL